MMMHSLKKGNDNLEDCGESSILHSRSVPFGRTSYCLAWDLCFIYIYIYIDLNWKILTLHCTNNVKFFTKNVQYFLYFVNVDKHCMLLFGLQYKSYIIYTM